MATDNELIFNMPFDEADGSKVAYDFSSNRADGTVTDCSFIGGRQGNCIEFNGNGYCEVNKNVIPLTGSFTLLAWIKRKNPADNFSGKRIGFFVCWDEVNGYNEYWFNLNAETWGYFSIVKDGLKLRIYLDTQLIETITLPAQPTGIAFLQDVYFTENGYGCIDEIKAYNYAFTQEEITNSIGTVTQLSYILDGSNLKKWDIYVSESEGLLDRPKMKAPLSVEWADYHGKIIDLERKRVDEREITLKCFMKATGKIDFATKLNEFLDVFSKDGTLRLMVEIHPTKPLVYEVYNEEGVAISKRWNDNLMVGTFTLKLKEPSPVKRVVRHQRISDSTKTLNITITTDKAVTIHWGDGTKNEDIYGDNVKVSHEYKETGVYYAIVAGVIEEIKSFDTNGVIVWNKL